MKVKKMIIVILFLLSTTVGISTIILTFSQITNENKECNEIEQSILELKQNTIKNNLNNENKGLNTNFDENMTRIIDWNALKNINNDIIGWLYIPNTNIDYPILQEQEAGKQYYLHHDYKKDEVYAGSVFTPKEPYNDVDDAHILLFAHRMKNRNIMFSSLQDYYSDLNTILENRYVYIYKEDSIERWSVWCTKSAESNDNIYLLPYYLGSEQYKNLILEIKNTSDNIVDDSPTENEKILVLSTCSGEVGGSNRFYVVFKIDIIK